MISVQYLPQLTENKVSFICPDEPVKRGYLNNYNTTTGNRKATNMLILDDNNKYNYKLWVSGYERFHNELLNCQTDFIRWQYFDTETDALTYDVRSYAHFLHANFASLSNEGRSIDFAVNTTQKLRNELTIAFEAYLECAKRLAGILG